MSAGNSANDKAPRCGACAVRRRIGYVTRSPASAEHRLIVMETTGAVRAIESERERGLRYARRMRQAYRRTTLSHKL